MVKDTSFSVLIPVYNCSEYIESCVQSVLNQTYDNYKIILVDDGSTDESGQICDRLAREHKNIICMHQENKGAVLARNYGLTLVDTDFFIFLDADDYWDEDLLEQVNNRIFVSGADMVFFRLRHVNEHGVLINEEASVFENDRTFSSKEHSLIFKEMISSSRLNNLVCKAISSQLIPYTDHTGCLGVQHAEDLMQSLPYIFNAKKIIYLDRVLYNYRNVPSSITHKVSPKFFSDISKVRQQLMYYIRKMKLDNQENIDAFNRYYLSGMLNYIPRIVGFIKEEKILYNIFQELEKITFFNEVVAENGLKGLRIHRKITLWFFVRHRYKLLIGFERTLLWLRHFRRSVIGGNNYSRTFRRENL